MASETRLLFEQTKKKQDIPKQFGPGFEKKFDRPMSHRNDSLGSYQAGDRVLKSGKLRGQIAAVYNALQRHPNTTSAELSRLSDLDRYMIARRLSVLVSRGLAERGPERLCSVCKCLCVTWRAVCLIFGIKFLIGSFLFWGPVAGITGPFIIQVN